MTRHHDSDAICGPAFRSARQRTAGRDYLAETSREHADRQPGVNRPFCQVISL